MTDVQHRGLTYLTVHLLGSFLTVSSFINALGGISSSTYLYILNGLFSQGKSC